MTVHFIHQRSPKPNAIPLLLTHGWPGSFDEFHQVITPLSNPGVDSNSSFHVIVPSLPGFGFSSPTPPGWTVNDTATLFNTLITDVLGYRSYIAVGGDWGCVVTWGLHNNHADHVQAVLYTGLIPQFGPTLQALLDDPRFADKVPTLSQEQKARVEYNTVFTTTDMGYFTEQSTKPATIGLALYDNPIGQLPWISDNPIGQLAWISDVALRISDPQFGVPPSTITNNTFLNFVTLYYLTQTFETATNIYYQNQGAFRSGMLHANNRIPMGLSMYPHDALYYPEFYVAEIGNLTMYSEHPRGGHFSALDNPPAYVSDIRKMSQWYKP